MGGDGTAVPRGVEVLLAKASVDTEFRKLLVRDLSRAARYIDLELDPSEAAMLDAISEAQLTATIARTTVRERDRKAFLGKVAAVMLAALAAASPIACDDPPKPKGLSPDRVEAAKVEKPRGEPRERTE